MIWTKLPRRTALVTTLLLVASVAAQESRRGPVQKEEYVGSGEFKTYCATCHGLSAKGDGPLAEHLRFRPPDLTQLTRRNDGKWDAGKVERIIDGRDPVKGHGGPDMPVWGDAFKVSRARYDEESIKARIRAIVEHLASLQETGGKPEK